MKKNETGNAGNYKFANISSIIVIILCGAMSILDGIKLESTLIQTLGGLCSIAALLLLIPVFKATKNYSSLGFYTPLVLLIFYIVLIVLGRWSSPYFLLGCIFFCGISSIYSNFRLTITYVIVQNLAIGIMLFCGFPLIGPNVPLEIELISWLISVFCSILLLILTKSSTVDLNEARSDSNSFRTLLTTTENYVAMIDDKNRIIYISKALAELADIEYPELAAGRSIIDLFPGRELKLLADRMLREKEKYESDWEFSLHGQKRYFKASASKLAGASKGTLVNLYDMTHLAERDEIAVMKDNLRIGLFLMDRNYIIQDHYSRFLEEMLSEAELFGKSFPDLLRDSVSAKELETIRDYFDMIFDRNLDQATLEEINPLSEFKYVSVEKGDKKIFNCNFSIIERARGEIFILVSIYDITVTVELEQRALEEESRRQEEMRSIFELIQVEPGVFNDFMEDADYEFNRINDILKNKDLPSHEVLVEIYQSVHAIKSNAVILGLNGFGEKVHILESNIKALREFKGEITFDDMLRLTMDLEELFQEKDGFKATIDKIESFRVANAEGRRQSEHVLVESLIKTANKTAGDTNKKVQLVIEDIDSEVLENGPRRLMKEILMQLIRNAVVHGIEKPELRLAKGKNETGAIRVSVKNTEDAIQLKVGDDGAGLDYVQIRRRAEELNMIRPEDEDNRQLLLKAIFSPGFSTAESEGVHAGRGIGLNLIRDRVRGENGSIKVQSEMDKGTIFNIYLPKQKQQ